MFRELPTLMSLLQQVQRIPYLASKNMYQVAEYFLKLKPEQVEQLCDILRNVTQNISPCARCFAWQEHTLGCVFCGSPKRDQSLVCVVETWQELISIEKTNGYNGAYHVLGGVICPLDGVGPENLTIQSLIERIRIGAIKEIVLATSHTPEGEATAAFIARKVSGSSVVISRLARGLPVGSSLNTMDRLTIYKALLERRPF